MEQITAQKVADVMTAYLYHQISLDDLVSWAETAMMDGEFADENYDTVRDIVSRLGMADVKAFGMTWEDFERFFGRLGYAVRIEVVAARSLPRAGRPRDVD